MLNQIKNIFTIDNLNNVVEWLKDYWWIVLIVGLVIIGICIALPLTYRKKKPIRKIIRRASTLRRPSTTNDVNAVANAQAGGIGTSRQRVARRRDQSRQPVLTASEFICSNCNQYKVILIYPVNEPCSVVLLYYKQLPLCTGQTK